MAGQLRHLHVFSRKHPSSSSSHPPSSTLNSTKLKTLTLIQTVVFSQLCRVVGAVAGAKSILLHILRALQMHLVRQLPMIAKKSKTMSNDGRKRKLFLGSFRLHYNWCSSHVVPAAAVAAPPLGDSIVSAARDECGGLSGYLDWLEEKVDCEESGDIDQIADMFIADCHERFRLEKVESDRRFQEMLARSV
ncbi:PREDICTED: uncharacterized protein LOC109181405 [Ipomoea nil]|uniref:uncharacterized protein LOC109181405 n=1 Tax=Ipomoea nil TaxID=35883 RepID=UPI000901B582|nr:PREDICTED: uncharacterized protein LOC109181405 [Ipomoea nil]